MRRETGRWQAVRTLMDQGIARGIFTGGVLLVIRQGKKRLVHACGHTDQTGRIPVTPDTCFDLASLTKPLATALLTADMAGDGLLDLNQTLSRWVDMKHYPDKSSITLHHLLRHTSGLPAHRPYYWLLMTRPSRKRPDVLGRLILGEPLAATPGKRQCYSDLGYMLLGQILEKVAGQDLDGLALQRLYRPLGLTLFFVRQGDANRIKPGQVAATEMCPWRGRLLQGEVHDDNAWALGGVAGHAGLFGTVEGVAGILDWVCSQLKAAGSHKRSEILRQMVRPCSGQTLAAGFDTPSPEGSSAGRWFPPRAVGHLGFTGTSFWMDPLKGNGVILLTNRVNTCRNDNKIREFRPVLHDLVMSGAAE